MKPIRITLKQGVTPYNPMLGRIREFIKLAKQGKFYYVELWVDDTDKTADPCVFELITFGLACTTPGVNFIATDGMVYLASNCFA
jgi:hypothetical protein